MFNLDAFDMKKAEAIMPGVTKRAEGFADNIEKTRESSLSGAIEYAAPALDEKIAKGEATPEFTRKFITKVHDLAFQVAVSGVLIAMIADKLSEVKSLSASVPSNEENDALQSAGGAA